MSISRTGLVCCDANIAVRYVTDPAAVSVIKLVDRWIRDGVRIVAPMLARYEMTNAIHRIYQLEGNKAAVEQAFRAALALPIDYRYEEDHHLEALRYARRFNLPAAYDAHYLAVTESLGVEFFTSDQKLHNSVANELPWVKLVR